MRFRCIQVNLALAEGDRLADTQNVPAANVPVGGKDLGNTFLWHTGDQHCLVDPQLQTETSLDAEELMARRCGQVQWSDAMIRLIYGVVMKWVYTKNIVYIKLLELSTQKYYNCLHEILKLSTQKY